MPYVTLVVFIGLLIGAFSIMGAGLVNFTFFPNLDDKAVFIELNMPPGTPVEVTTAKLETIRQAAARANATTKEQYGKELIKYVEVLTGPRPNEGTLRVTYVNSEQREISSFDLSDMIRAEAPEFPEADNVVYGIGATSAVFGRPVSIALRGKNLENLRAARDELKDAMLERSDIKDVADTDQQGVQEAIIRLNPAGEQLGLSLAGVMAQVRTAFFGQEVQSLQRGDEEVEVWVRYPRVERESEASLLDMRIAAPGGGSFPLSEVAYLDYGTGNQSIKRLKGEREIRVEANVANIGVSAPAVIGALQSGPLAEIESKYPGVTWSAEGQSRESEKMGGGAGLVFPIVLIIMLALIVIAFNSFSQALLTFGLYPFAFIGVIVGHWIQGEALNVFSIIGTIALIGVFTNNSLVLVSTFNQLLEDGEGFFEALKQATVSRFRPILLTTVTTVAGLAPLLASSSLSAQFLQGPAIAMAYGLSFGLFNVLFLLPALLVIMNQGRRFLKRVKTLNRVKATPAEVEPAVRAKAYQVFTIALFLFAGTCVRAQTVMPLDQTIETALANNPKLAILAYDKRISERNIDPALVGLSPTIDVNAAANFGWADAQVETINLGPPGSENPPLKLDGIRHGILIQPEANWLVYDGGAARTRLEQLRIVDRATANRLQILQEQVVADVMQTYLGLASLGEQLGLAEANIDLSRERLARVTRATEYGNANSLRRLQSEVDLNTDSVAYQNLELQLGNQRRSLNLLLGRDPETPLATQNFSQLNDRLAYDELEQSLLARNPQLKALALQRELSENALEQERLANMPKVALYANVLYLNQTDNANFLLQNRNFGTETGVRVSYNLFDGGARKTRQAVAQLQVERDLRSRQTTELQLTTALRQAYAGYENAYDQLAFERRNLPTFELNFTKTQTDFRNGQTDATDLRTAQVNLNAARTRITLLEFGVRRAEVRLLALSGGLLR